MNKVIYPALALFLMGCGNGGTGSSESNLNNAFGAEPVDLKYSGVDTIAMGAPGVYYHLEASCTENGQFTYDTSRATNYLIQGGNLYLIGEDDCLAKVLHGTSTTLSGKWTFNGEYQPMPGMDTPDEFECDNPQSLVSQTGTLEFSSTSIHADMTLNDFCWAQLSSHTDDESGDSMKMVTCDSLIWIRNGKQASLKLISYDIGDQGNPTVFRFDFNGVSCTRHKASYLPPSPETCSQAYQAYLANPNPLNGFYYWSYGSVFRTDIEDQNAYNACVVGAGFTVSGYEPGQ